MTEQFLIKGLGGEKRLSGTIRVTGAKNAVLKSFAASLLFEDTLAISNVPEIEDVARVSELLQALGASVEKKEHAYALNTSAVTKSDLDDAIARRLRASIVFTGPLLARFGKVSFPYPGGDIIGPRPIDLFLDGFTKMGADVTFDGRYTISTQGGLRGADIFFTSVTVTGTETLMMAATLAKGKTVLKNAAMEPEIMELANFLNSCGAQIHGVGTPTITIEGGGMLKADGKTLRTIPDRIEAGSFLILGALAANELEIVDCNPAHIEMLIELLRASGLSLQVGEDSIKLSGNTEKFRLEALQVRTHEYPGFATDLQPPMTVYLTQAEGESTVFETIYLGRLNYTEDLVSMGADIKMGNPQQITIKGPTPLSGRRLESPDIRAGLAFLLAASIAKGDSVINTIYHIDRGYERIEERLSKIGLDITRRAAP